jgi:Tol biopolymer transport system component
VKHYLIKPTVLFVVMVLLACSPSEVGRGYRLKHGGAYSGSNPSFSPDGAKIVFGSPSTGLGDIYVIDANDGNRKRLTDSPDYDGEPSFTPDGKNVLFVSERDNGHTGHLYMMNSDGSNQHSLTRSKYYDTEPSISPDGSKIAFVRIIDRSRVALNHSAIFIVSADGKEEIRLTQKDEVERSPSFSPDGKKILYSVMRDDGTFDLMQMNSDGSQSNLLIKGVYSGEFSPDGAKIVFQSMRIRPNTESSYEQSIYIASSDGTHSLRLPSVEGESPHFAPDGKRIVFLGETDSRGRGPIMITNLDGTGLRTIAKNY